MSVVNSEIRVISDSMVYEPMPFGMNAGKPTVRMKLSKSEQNSKKISSLEGLFSNWGWADKIDSGFARLYLHGNSTLAHENSEAIENLCHFLNPIFLDVETDLHHIENVPTRTVQNLIDRYIVFVPDDEEEMNTEAMEFFADQSRNFDNVEFMFKFESPSQESRIQKMSRKYKLYDSSIWLYPKGTTPHTVQESREWGDKVAKRNTWNVSPRMDIAPEIDEDAD